MPLERADTCWRETVVEADPESIRALVAATGMFTEEEVAIAAELPAERLAQGPASGYDFTLLDGPHGLLGYACYGRIPGSDISWDLYWIAVAKPAQGSGLGSAILARAQASMRRAGAVQVFVETSSRPDYAATRRFYEKTGHGCAARFADFYRAGDDKLVYVKRFS